MGKLVYANRKKARKCEKVQEEHIVGWCHQMISVEVIRWSRPRILAKGLGFGQELGQKIRGPIISIIHTFCKKTGHSESQCYKKKLPPSLMSLNENGNKSVKEKKISWKEIKEKNLYIKCLQLGHKKKDCPECSTPKDGCFLLPEEEVSADASASFSMEEDSCSELRGISWASSFADSLEKKFSKKKWIYNWLNSMHMRKRPKKSWVLYRIVWK